MRDRLVSRPRARRAPHFAEPRSPGQRRLSRRRVGLLAAFAIAIAVNLIVIALHGPALSSQRPQSLRHELPVQRIDHPATVRSLSLLDGVARPTARPAASKPRAALDTGVDAITAAAQIVEAPAAAPVVVDEPEDDGRRLITAEILPRQTVAGALLAQGLAADAVHEVIQALSDKFDFRRSRPGDALSIELDGDERVQRVEYRAQAGGGAGALFVARREASGLVGEELEVQVDVRTALVHGQVHSTLYESMLATGEGTSLIGSFTEVFGWEIDFHREVQDGDRFKLLIEKRYVDDRFIGYGRLLAAEYRTRERAHRAFFFQDDAVAGYFNDEGESLQKTFLKSPVAVSRVTSTFGQRKHPILGYTRAHNGVDYGVPKGTPVWTVADGTVTKRHFEKGYGNVVVVRHPNGYETTYAHLSKFAKLDVGSKVRQRQVIGYCGSTGLSTGPHVHFGMTKHGHFVNPLAQKFPRGQAIPKASRNGFASLLQQLAARLDAVEIALAPERTAGQG